MLSEIKAQWRQTLELDKDCNGVLPWRKIQRELNVDSGRARGLAFAVKYFDEITNHLPAGEKASIEKSFKPDSATITTKSLNIKTLNDALKASDVDLDVWEVERHVINSWEVTMGGEKTKTGKPETYTNYQVKVWLKRRIEDFKEVALSRFVDRLTVSKFKPEPVKHIPKKSPKMLEISLVDHHFGMLAWNRETNNDYDLQIAERFYLNAVDDLIDKTKHFNIGKILFPIGSDFFHINNAKFMTPQSNAQMDVDGRLAKVFETGEMAVFKAIERCRQVAPTKLVWIRGNHDPETSFYLARVIKAYYHQCPEVEVDAEPTARKYEQFGNNLIGFCHLDQEKKELLPSIMATEAGQAWVDTTYHEVHGGHLHKQKEIKFVGVDEYPGVLIRHLPSLSMTDAWHYLKGFIGRNHAAMSFAWDYEGGLSGQFPTYVKSHNDAL